MTSETRWYVVQTQTRSEAKAMAHLLRQGYQVYLPRYLKRRRHARAVDAVAAPLFPGYLFVAVDLGRQRWRSILSTIGVRRLICNGEAPAPLPASTIEAVRSREGQGGFIKLPARTPYARGEKLRVLDGIFASCLGLYEGMTDNERVNVLVDLLGRKVRMTFDYEAVAAA